MMNMMHTNGWGFGLIFLWGLHILSVIAFFAGALLLMAWAFKHLSAAQMKKWGWTLVIGGTVVCLFTIGVMGHSWTSYGGGKTRMMQGTGWDNKDELGMGMSMNGMTMMLQGKTGDDFDRAFLQMMITHHEGAIEMATLAQQNAKHVEVKTMANGIISAQQREIDQMKQWQKTWGYTQ